MTDNVTRTAEPTSRLATLWSVLANWRDWNLPVKLAAVTLVPVVFAIVLGAMQIADQVDKAGAYRRVDRLVVVNQELRTLIGALQRERTAAVELLAAHANDVGTQLADERRAVDSARHRFAGVAGRVTLDEETTSASFADAQTWLDELPDIRRQATRVQVDSSTALGRYTDVIDTLLRFDRTIVAESIDPTLAATSSALYELEFVGEQVAYQHALIGGGIVRRGLSGPDLESLRASAGRLSDGTTAFYAVAGAANRDAFDQSVRGTGVAARNNVVGVLLASRPGTPVPATAQDWADASKLTTSRIGEVASSLGKQLRDRSAALQDEASDGAGLAAVILLVALVVAIAVMFVVGRHLLSSLSVLRRSALDVAEHTLPEAVARIRDRGDAAAPVEVAPVPVGSMDEVGQVARAFDAVQRQALRLATEQAGLRAKYSSVFVNLSRRSQGLVQRQLQLLERLERDEEDSDQLSTLFQLDHLATRMRRNNENLMVLSGSDVGRRNQRPAAIEELLRAAVSEVEQYQRVVMLPPPSVRIVGYGVGDLVRLTAELLDNATAFSAPDTQVTIASHEFEDGSVCIAVLDEGIGMSQAELDEANAKLADSGSIDVSTSRRMGLFVIGRLAGRHGIDVRLNGGSDVTGVRATVTVPADVVIPSEPRASDPPAAASSNGHANGSANGFTNGALPRRSFSTNGSEIGRRLGTGSVGEPRTETGADAEPGAELDADVAAGAEVGAGDRTDADTGGGADADTGVATDGDGDARSAGEPGTDGAGAGEAGVGEAGVGGDRADRAGKAGGGMPLPRRSPGERMPGPALGQAGPSDIARPRLPFTAPGREVSSAEDLFTPSGGEGSGWWSGRGRSVGEETTPIFDEMVSVWFRAPDKQPAPKRTDGESPADEQWRFAADSGFDTARAVSRAEPAEFTKDGLPRRNAGRNLVPGSADDSTPAGGPRHGRDPSDVRERLSNYRHGVRRARDHRQAVEPNAHHSGSSPEPAEQPADGGQQVNLFVPSGDRGGRPAPTGPGTGSSSGQPGPAESDGLAADGHSADGHSAAGQPRHGQSATEELAPGEPSGGQSAPGQPVGGPMVDGRPGNRQPAFGSPGDGQPFFGQPAAGGQPFHGQPHRQPPFGQPAHGQPPDGQPANSRAAHGQPPYGQPPYGQPVVGQPQPVGGQQPFGQAQGQPAHGQQAFGQPQGPRAYGQQAFGQPQGQPANSQPAGQSVSGQPADGQPPAQQATLDLSGAGWRFAADVGWRAANAVSTSTPVDFTSGGLPRRSAGNQLMPGGIAPAGGGPLRMDRAEEVRGRLGRFQRGLSRGRRSLAERSDNGFDQQESE